ncbi:MAG: ferritin family protein [Proteobacteria bacterium]|nr:ferritin family protein [Pseudomonadota bacterium]
MKLEFSAEEIFEMAVQIERNGAKFYRKASEGKLAQDDQIKKLLLDLSGMEDQHEKVFSSMAKELTGPEKAPMIFDPDNELGLYLQAMADGRVVDTRTEPAEKLKDLKKLEDLFAFAIGLEKDSIVFYTGMKEVVPEHLGKNRLDKIIREEIGHIAFLNREINARIKK